MGCSSSSLFHNQTSPNKLQQGLLLDAPTYGLHHFPYETRKFGATVSIALLQFIKISNWQTF